MDIEIKVFEKTYSLDIDESEISLLKEVEKKIEKEFQKKREAGYPSKDCYCMASLLTSFEIIKEKDRLRQSMLEVEDDLYMLKQTTTSSDGDFIEID